MNIISVALFGETHRFGTHKDDRVFLASQCGIGDHKPNGDFVGVVFGMREADTELTRHDSVLFSLDEEHRRRHPH